MYCKKCGEKMSHDDKYCKVCGATYYEESKEKIKPKYDKVFLNFTLGRFAFFSRIAILPPIVSCLIGAAFYFIFDIKSIVLILLIYILSLIITIKGNVQYYDHLKVYNDEFFLIVRNFGKSISKYKISAIGYATVREHPKHNGYLTGLYEIYSTDGIKLFEAVNGTGIVGILKYYDIEIRKA